MQTLRGCLSQAKIINFLFIVNTQSNLSTLNKKSNKTTQTFLYAKACLIKSLLPIKKQLIEII